MVKFALGSQKWKSKCKVQKSDQKWSERAFTFAPSSPPLDNLVIKVKNPLVGGRVLVYFFLFSVSGNTDSSRQDGGRFDYV